MSYHRIFVAFFPLVFGAAVTGCQIPVSSAPPTIRKILTKASPSPMPTPESVHGLTADQIKTDLLHLELITERGHEWTFDSPAEFRDITILSTETAGDRDIFTVRLKLAGDPSGEEAEAVVRLTYLRSEGGLIFDSLSCERFTLTDDRRYIGRERFPSGATYHSKATLTLPTDTSAAPVRRDTTVHVAEETDAYQHLEIEQQVISFQENEEAENDSVFPAPDTRTTFVKRFHDGSTEKEDRYTHPLFFAEGIVPLMRVGIGSIWQGKIQWSDSESVRVEANATDYVLYEGRRALAVGIASADGGARKLSGQVILDTATGLPVHADITLEQEEVSPQSTAIRLVLDGHFEE